MISGPARTIRVFIADKELLNLQGLRALFAHEPDFEVAGTCTDSTLLTRALLDSQPDVALVDARMVSAFADREFAQSALRELKVLVLSDPELASHFDTSIAAACSGHVLRTDSFETLCAAVRALASGEPWNPYSDDAIPPALTLRLSPRERDVAALVSEGLSNREIGQELGLGEQSVKNLVSQILKKHGLRNRTQIALLRMSFGRVRR